MEAFLKLGFFSMADKVTDALGRFMPFILTGSVIAAIWIYFLLLVPKHQKHYDSIISYIRDVLQFRVMIGSALAKILYIAFSLVLIIVGFVAMFVANFLVGLVGTILLEIILRVMFELFMLAFSIHENVVAIREHKDNIVEHVYYEDEE